MNKLYRMVWNFTQHIHEKTQLKKQSVFLFLNIFLWCLAGGLVYCLLLLLPDIKFSFVTMWVVIGYFGVIMGLFGSIMYIFRNTTPDDLE